MRWTPGTHSIGHFFSCDPTEDIYLCTHFYPFMVDLSLWSKIILWQFVLVVKTASRTKGAIPSAFKWSLLIDICPGHWYRDGGVPFPSSRPLQPPREPIHASPIQAVLLTLGRWHLFQGIQKRYLKLWVPIFLVDSVKHHSFYIET